MHSFFPDSAQCHLESSTQPHPPTSSVGGTWVAVKSLFSSSHHDNFTATRTQLGPKIAPHPFFHTEETPPHRPIITMAQELSEMGETVDAGVWSLWVNRVRGAVLWRAGGVGVGGGIRAARAVSRTWGQQPLRQGLIMPILILGRLQLHMGTWGPVVVVIMGAVVATVRVIIGQTLQKFRSLFRWMNMKQKQNSGTYIIYALR